MIAMTNVFDDLPLEELDLMTVAEVATVMRVAKMTIYRLIQAGSLPATKIGGTYRVPRPSVQAYLSGNAS